MASKRFCPLCNEPLELGLRVYSTMFPGKEFDLMHIFGCKNCWNGERTFPSIEFDSSSAHQKPFRSLNKRRCPCCNEELPKDGYVMARVYKRPYRPLHVHVYGCIVCKPRA